MTRKLSFGFSFLLLFSPLSSLAYKYSIEEGLKCDLVFSNFDKAEKYLLDLAQSKKQKDFESLLKYSYCICFKEKTPNTKLSRDACWFLYEGTKEGFGKDVNKNFLKRLCRDLRDQKACSLLRSSKKD